MKIWNNYKQVIIGIGSLLIIGLVLTLVNNKRTEVPRTDIEKTYQKIKEKENEIEIQLDSVAEKTDTSTTVNDAINWRRNW